jgi:hypothetical protein
MSRIAEHPDIKRILMTMRALTSASRAVCFSCAMARDLGETARMDLLTPVAKAFASDAAFEVASLSVQVHGGAGYIEATGAAQVLRDSRISAIYEGTNGIQAIDLVTRKLPMEEGGVLRDFIAELREIGARAAAKNREDFGKLGARVLSSLDDLEAASAHLLSLLAAGKAAGGAYLAKGALASLDDSTPQAKLRVATARFMAERLMPETAALKSSVIDGAEAVLSVDAGMLAEAQ